MIRKATVEDLPKLLPCAVEFSASSKFLNRFSFESFLSSWEKFLDMGIGVIFIEESGGDIHGCIGGVKYRDPNTGRMVATEFFWFVRMRLRGCGIRLYREFETWARDNGCQDLRMVHLMDSMPEELDRFYKRNGFEEMEIHYTKELIK